MGKSIAASSLPTEGLVALYSPKSPGGYTAGTIVDLSGNGNDLALTGNYYITSSALYSGSVFFASGSHAITGTDLSASLHGTGSQYTIISFTAIYGDGGINYIDPIWWIGGPTSSADQKQIYNGGVSETSPGWGIGVSNKNYSSYPQTQPWLLFDNPDSYRPGATSWIATREKFGVGNNPWSFQAVSKGDQTPTYTGADTNLTIYSRGYGVANPGPIGEWKYLNLLNSDVYGYAYTEPQYSPVITGSKEDAGFIYNLNLTTTGNKFSTNLDNSILLLSPVGGGVTNPSYAGAYRTFYFGGMVIYDRVLSADEVSSICSFYFNQY